MKKFLILVLAVFLPVAALASSGRDNFLENLDYAGYLEQEIWVQTGSNQYLSAMRNTLDLQLEYTFSDQMAFFFNPRFFYDSAYDIRSNDQFRSYRSQLGTFQRQNWLRDCYLDFTSEQFDIRIGKQQVVWGEADGIPFLDRVMPFDLTYTWLPDFADIRVPLWMLRVDYSPVIDSTFQFLFIPDFKTGQAAPAGAPFALRAVNDFEAWRAGFEGNGRVVNTFVEHPAQNFKNSRIGLRWNSMVGDTQYSLNWLYGYSPTAYTYTISEPPVYGMPGNYDYARRHKKVHLIGASFNHSFLDPGLLQGFTTRGEFVYFKGEPTYYGEKDGRRKFTTETDKFAYVLGLERTYFRNWDFSFQFAQFIHEHEKIDGFQVLNTFTQGTQRKVANTFTLRVATDFMHERLQPEVLVIYGASGEGRVSSKLQYEVRDDLWFNLGYHYFWGGDYGAYGQYRKNDHIVSGIKYTF